MKSYKKIARALLVSTLILPMTALSLNACSSGSSDDEQVYYAGIMTAENFASLSYSFQIYATAAVYIVPTALTSNPDAVHNEVSAFGYLRTTAVATDDEPGVQAHYIYTTEGNLTADDAPSSATLTVALSSPEAQNTIELIRALGFRDEGVTQPLAELEFQFDYVTKSLTVLGRGAEGGIIQPGGSGSTEDTDGQEAIYNYTYAIRRSL